MNDLRLQVFTCLAVLVSSATLYSITNNTYLDTSNPLLTNLPHPLAASDYFANKRNFLNVYFIKQAWGWTTGVFFLSWFTSPPSIRTKERVWKWLATTGMWLAFAAWFFGPALLERLTVASGGECVLALPSGDPLTVPVELCFTRTQLSPGSHPELFVASSGFAPSADWRAVPRLRRGHDVSGHLFLLTMAIMFLVDQLQYSLRLAKRGTLHTLAIGTNILLIMIWTFATYTTCVYFHTPLEKVTGFLLGAFCFAVTTVLPEAPLPVEKPAKTKKN